MLNLTEAGRWRKLFQDADAPKAFLLLLWDRGELRGDMLAEPSVDIVAVLSKWGLISVLMVPNESVRIFLTQLGFDVVKYFKAEWVDELQMLEEVEGDLTQVTKEGEKEQVEKQVKYFTENTLEKGSDE